MKESYGFEIEFCTHDNTMLRYTHVTVARTNITGNGVLDHIPLSLETDSSDVLELVTPPIIFAHRDGAKRFKQQLTDYITGTVLQARTLENWLQNIWEVELRERLVALYTECRNHINDGVVPVALEGEVNWVFNNDHPGLDAIRHEINVNNIDDGINIAAAKFLSTDVGYDLNAIKRGTILAPSMKDFEVNREGAIQRSFSTQTSIPMEAEAYVNYKITTKYPKARQRLASIIDNSIVNNIEFAGVKWSKVDRWLGSWAWHGITMLAWERTLLAWGKTTGLDNTVNGNLAALRDQLGDIDQDVVEKLNADALVTATNFGALGAPQEVTNAQRAISYIAIQKIISGALGGLSERNQLQAQQQADQDNTSCRLEPLEWVQAAPQDVWKEYHSSLKDLTSVWFKGWLKDVAYLYRAESVDLSQHLEVLNADMWKAILRQHWLIVEEICFGFEYKAGPSINYLSEENLNVLAQRLGTVTTATREMLATAQQDNFNQVPAHNGEHAFLEYDADNLCWEGRKDTLVRPITNTDALPRIVPAFLVEHRNN